jgi:DNA-binding NarL/FixJ family response regulator
VPIRVLLADDQPRLRATFRLLFDAASDIEVVGEASTGAEALARARADRADVVLMDLRMPDMDGIEATRLITADESLAGVRVLILTTFETDELVVAALRAGASGYLGKDVEPAALLDAVRTVAGGESLLSATATTALIQRFLARSASRMPADPPIVADLTTREREVTVLVASGFSNEEIGEQLLISPSTAETHVNRAIMKIDARDRAQLVVFAYENGLMVPGRTPSQG